MRVLLNGYDSRGLIYLSTWPALPAKVLGTGQELREFIDADKEHLLGSNVVRNFDAQLPFLPKVLSTL